MIRYALNSGEHASGLCFFKVSVVANINFRLWNG